MRLQNLAVAVFCLAALLLAPPSLAGPRPAHRPAPEPEFQDDRDRNGPPPQAAAAFQPSAGACIQFISVWVPSHSGHYVVGISFAYRDRDYNGSYTPGVDRLQVCVNCFDACGWGP